MRFRFSARVSIFCGVLALLMLRASYWQYERYVAKKAYIAELGERLKQPIEELQKLLHDQVPVDQLYHLRVRLSGTWDYEHEVILRNRKFDDVAGAYVLTPLKLRDSEQWILVSRGFVPLSSAEKSQRVQFQNGPTDSFLGLVKETTTRKFLAPEDPLSGNNLPWVDAWLRVDVDAIAKQLPYSIAPFYVEMMSRDSSQVAMDKLLVQKSDRDQMLFLPGAGATLNSVKADKKEAQYPVPVFDTIVPPGRHYSYIFEWGIMAAMVTITGILLQFRPPRPKRS